MNSISIGSLLIACFGILQEADDTPRPRNIFLKAKLEDDKSWVGQTVAVSPDGQYIAAPGRLNREWNVRVWNAKTGKIIQKLPFATEIGFVVFTPDSKRLATMGTDQPVVFWNVADWEMDREIPETNAGTGRLFFGKNQDEVVVMKSLAFCWWNAKTQKFRQTLKTDFGVCTFADISHDLKQIAFGSGSGEIQTFDDQRANPKKWQATEGPIHYLEFSPDGKYLAAVGKVDILPAVIISDLGKSEVVGHLTLPRPQGWTHVYQLKFDKSTGLLAVACSGNRGALPLFDLPSRQQKYNLIGLTTGFNCVAFFPNGRKVVAGARDGQFGIWELPPWEKGK